MKICLPTENWNDVFGFLPRPQLAELVSQIGDWYFASKAQFYLHECGQITLGRLYIQLSANGTGPVIVKEYQQQELTLADVPMPKNIKNFRAIIVNYNSSDSWFCDWLKTPKLDGKPRLLALYYNHDCRSIAPLVEHLKKDFILAQHSVNYLVKILWFKDTARIEACTLDNGQTNERLVINRTEAVVSISRYPIESNEEWLNEMTRWGSNIFNNLYPEYRNIYSYINF